VSRQWEADPIRLLEIGGRRGEKQGRQMADQIRLLKRGGRRGEKQGRQIADPIRLLKIRGRGEKQGKDRQMIL
jgi:hypothetical protein